MPDIVDKIVRMVFDNKAFESAAGITLSTLDTLKSSISDLASGGVSTALGGLETGIQAIGGQFSALETIAVGALLRIGSQAVDTGERLVKSLTVDQLAEGFDKYSKKTESVATLVSQGYELDEVNEKLEKLNWFSDETSYTFTDMVDNISKFTAVGVELDDATEAMMGIALWAASAGQGASAASQAMYQLSQAMASGYMQRQDWVSITNRNMDTTEFKSIALEAGAQLGTLKALADGTYETLNGTQVTVENFVSTLTEEKWFTSDVMMAAFRTYSAAVDQLYDVVSDENNGIDTASEAIEYLNGNVDETALKFFKAGQEARTFTAVIDSIKDAVSTVWMSNLELIFGDYEQAVELFTDMSNEFYDLFTTVPFAVQDVLTKWNEFGGRDELVAGFWELYDAVTSIVDIFNSGISAAFFDFGGEDDTEKVDARAHALVTFCYNVRDAFAKLSQFIDEHGDSLASFVQGVGDGFGIFFDFLGEMFDLAKKFAGDISLGDMLGSFVDALGDFGGKVSDIRSKLQEWDVIGTLLESVSSSISSGWSFMSGLFDDIKKDISDKLSNAGFDLDLDGLFSKIFRVSKTTFTQFLKFDFDPEKGIFSNISTLFSNFKTNFEKTGITETIDSFVDSLIETFKNSKLGKIVAVIEDYGQKILDAINGIFFKLTGINIADNLEDFRTKFGEAFDTISEIFSDDSKSPLQKIKDGLKVLSDTFLDTNIGKSLDSFYQQIKSSSLVQLLQNIGTAIGNAITNFLGIFTPQEDEEGNGGLLLTIFNGFDSVVQKISEKAPGLGKLLEGLRDLWDGFKPFFDDFLGSIGEKLSELGNKLKTGEINVTLKDILDATKTIIKILAAMAIAVSIYENVKAITSAVNTVGDFVGTINSVVKKVTKMPAEGASDSIIDSIGSLAKSFAMIAAVVFVFAEMDKEKLGYGLFIAVALGAGMIELMNVVSKFKVASDSKQLIALGTMGIEMGAALILIARAISILGSLDLGTLAKGMIASGLILAALEIFLIISSSDLVSPSAMANAAKVGLMAIEVVIAMILLTGDIIVLGLLPWDTFMNGITKVALMMYALGAMVVIMGNETKNLDKVAGVILTVTIAIIALTAAVKSLAKVNEGDGSAWEGVIQIILVMGAIVGTLFTLDKIFEKSTNLKKVIFALASAISVVSVMATVATKLSEIPTGDLIKGLAGIAAILLLFIGFSELIKLVSNALSPLIMVAMTASMILLAVAVAAMTVPIMLLSKFSAEELISAELAIAGILVIFTLFSAIASLVAGGFIGVIAAAAAMIALAAGLSAMYIPMMLFAKLDIASVGTALLAIVGVMVAMAAGLALLTPFIGTFVALAAGIMLISAGAAAAAGALMLFAMVLDKIANMKNIGDIIMNFLISIAEGLNAFNLTLVNGFTEIGTALLLQISMFLLAAQPLVNEFINFIFNSIEHLVEKIFELIGVILDQITLLIPKITALGQELIDSIFDLIQTFVDNVFDLATNLLDKVIDLMTDYIPRFIHATFDLINAMLVEIRSHIREFTAEALKIIAEFIRGISDGLPDIINSAFELVLSFLNGLAEAIENNGSAIIEAAFRLVKAVITAIGTAISNGALWLKENGGDIVKNFLEGIYAFFSNIVQAGANIVGGLSTGVKSVWNKMKEVGGKLITKIGEGINDAKEWLIQKGKDILSWIKDGTSGSADDSSLANIGKDIASGITGGISGSLAEFDISSLTSSFDTSSLLGNFDLGSSLSLDTSNLTAGLDMNSILGGIDTEPTITPVLDLSNIQNGSSDIQNLLGGSSMSLDFDASSYAGMNADSILSSMNGADLDSMLGDTYNNTTIENNITINSDADPDEIADEVISKINKSTKNKTAAAGGI